MYLRFDDLSLAVGVEPVYIYLTVKVTNVADNRVIQHLKQGLVTFLVRLFQEYWTPHSLQEGCKGGV